MEIPKDNDETKISHWELEKALNPVQHLDVLHSQVLPKKTIIEKFKSDNSEEVKKEFEEKYNNSELNSTKVEQTLIDSKKNELEFDDVLEKLQGEIEKAKQKNFREMQDKVLNFIDPLVYQTWDGDKKKALTNLKVHIGWADSTDQIVENVKLASDKKIISLESQNTILRMLDVDTEVKENFEIKAEPEESEQQTDTQVESETLSLEKLKDESVIVESTLETEPVLNIVEPPPLPQDYLDGLPKEPPPLPQEYLDSLNAETMESMKEKLGQARAVFASENIAFKNAQREKKSKYRKIMADLGFPGKQLPDVEKPQSLIDAEKSYIEAKKNIKMKKYIDGLVFDSKKEIEQAEIEYSLLQKQITESVPPLEKGIIIKSFEKWAKLPLPTRIALSTALITSISLAVGSVGVAGVVGYGTLRFGKSLAGGVFSQKVGKTVDSILKGRTESKFNQAMEENSKVLDSENFEQIEKSRMEAFEKRENSLKKNKLVKAMAMVGSGVGLTASLNVLQGIGENVAGSFTESNGRGSNTLPDETPQKTGFFENMKKKIFPEEKSSSVKDSQQIVNKIPEQVKAKAFVPEKVLEHKPVSVSLSEKGFIDTIAKLKEQVKLQYGDVTKAPENVQEILRSDPTQLAIKYGFYRPESEFQSAFGLKGENLVLDKNGNLIVEHLNGKVETIVDAKSGAVHKFSGKMFDAETGEVGPAKVEPFVPTETNSTQTPPQKAIISGETISSAKGINYAGTVVSGTLSSEIPSNVSSDSKVADISSAKTIDSTVVAGNAIADAIVEKQKELDADTDMFTVDGQKIAEIKTNFLPVDLALGKAPINKDLQFSKEGKEAKKQYNIQFEKMSVDWPEGTVDYRMPIDYQGGRIQALQKGNDITILLNGEKIGTGLINNGGIGFDYESSLPKGMLTIKSDYELAFEKAKSEILKKSNMFIRKSEKEG